MEQKQNLRGKLMEKPLKGLLPKTLYLCSKSKKKLLLRFFHFPSIHFPKKKFHSASLLENKKLRIKKRKTANFKECYWKNIKQINYIVMCISIAVATIHIYTHKKNKYNIAKKKNFLS